MSHVAKCALAEKVRLHVAAYLVQVTHHMWAQRNEFYKTIKNDLDSILTTCKICNAPSEGVGSSFDVSPKLRACLRVTGTFLRSAIVGRRYAI